MMMCPGTLQHFRSACCCWDFPLLFTEPRVTHGVFSERDEERDRESVGTVCRVAVVVRYCCSFFKVQTTAVPPLAKAAALLRSTA